MAGSDNLKKFLGKAVKFFEDLVDKIKKTDRKLIIMIAAAAVLLIVILALLINGISSNKEKNEPSTEPPAIVQEPEYTTDDNDIAALTETGKYKVDTDGLNLRPSANTDYAPITQIPKDTVVTVLFVDDSQVESSSDYGWAYVEYNGQRGWVSMEYLVKQ